MATDNFNRADSGNLGANWTNGSNGMQILTNRAVAAVDVAFNTAFYSGVAFSGNHSSEALVNHGGVSRMGLTVRQTGADCYYIDIKIDSSATELWKLVSSSFTQIGGNLGAPTNAHTYKLDASGTTLKVYDNGAQMSTDQSDAALSGGAPGIMSITTLEALDDWVGSDGAPRRFILGTH